MGRMACFSPMPDTGSNWSLTEMYSISSIATQKLGIDWPKTAMMRTMTSKIEPRVMAANVPRGTASAMPMNIAPPARIRVRTMARPTTSVIGSSYRNDLMVSPRQKPPMKEKYWT